MDIKSTFITNMKKQRISKRLSQEKLAELSGLHRTYISMLERGKRNISITNIGKIADALDIEAYKLFIPEHKEDNYV